MTSLKSKFIACIICYWKKINSIQQEIDWSSHQRYSLRLAVLENGAKLKGKHLFWSLFFKKARGWRPVTFPVNFVKFMRTPFSLKQSCGYYQLCGSGYKNYIHSKLLSSTNFSTTSKIMSLPNLFSFSFFATGVRKMSSNVFLGMSY